MLIQIVKKRIASIAFCLLVCWAIKNKAQRSRRALPSVSINQKQFFRQVKNGDLLATLSSNNWMSRIHSLGLSTPIAHVGIAIVEEEGNEGGNVYMFESGAPRGAQLRNLTDYMKDGADCLWWKPIRAGNETREKIISAVEQASSLAYSWSFLKSLPKKIVGFEAPGDTQILENACSCADLLAIVYKKAGILESDRVSWLPMDFLEKSAVFGDPLNVIFDCTFKQSKPAVKKK